MIECIAQVTANARIVSDFRDGEGLHQMRVGLRRLLTAMKLFAAPAFVDLYPRVKALATVLSPARDLDVLMAVTLEPMAEAIGRSAVERLRKRATPMRDAAWDRAVAAVSGDEFAALIEDLALAAGQRHGMTLRTLPAKRFAEAALDGLLETARRRGRHFSSLEAGKRHRLRIALKNMRYAAEIFSSLYRKKKPRRYIERLRRLQDGLGALNDAASVVGYCRRRRGPVPERIAAFQQAHTDELLRRMRREWKKLKKQKPFWQ